MQLGKLKNGTIIDLTYAKKVIEENKKEVDRRVRGTVVKKPEFFGGLTTSKLRNLLTLVNNVYTQVYNDPSFELSESVLDELEYLKVKFAYEAGREASVDQFIKKTHLSTLIDLAVKNKSRKYFLDYCKYFEALVAYAKFYKMGD